MNTNIDEADLESLQLLQMYLLNSIERVAELLKTVGHSKRLETLVRLLKGPKGFGRLMKETGLTKTALANHLTKLMDKGLIERFERGQYRITDDGQELMQSAATVYRTSLYREQARQKEIRRQVESSLKLRAEKKVDEGIVSKEPVYQRCWISYLGAVAGVLQSMGKDFDIFDVGGFTGYAFWTCSSKEKTCPSAPTAYGTEVRAEIHEKGMDSFGVKSRWVDWEEGGLPEGPLLPQYDQRALELFNTVKEEIKKNHPVILWGIPVPEWGIVKGFREQSYLVSTFRHLENMLEDPIKYNEIKSPGMIAAQSCEPSHEQVDQEAVDKKAIERAILLAEGPLPKWLAEMYVAGPTAYKTWAALLEDASARSYMGNSYVAACTQEGKAAAAEFLDRMARRYEGRPQEQPLLEASKAYKEAVTLLERFVKEFPFAFEGDMPETKCKEGAAILRSAEKPERDGIHHLKASLEAWQ